MLKAFGRVIKCILQFYSKGGSLKKVMFEKSVKRDICGCTMISMLSLFPFVMGCAGTSKVSATPEKASVSTDKKKTDSRTQKSICEIHSNGERTDVVVSKQNDWIVPVVKGGQVECDSQSGIAKVAMSGIHINLTVSQLSPYICFEQALQLLLEGYIHGVSESVAFETPLSFEEKRVGEYRRRALVSDGRFTQDGQRMHLLTAVTGVVNSRNQAIFHVVFWKLPESDLRKNEQLAHDTLATISASWYRLSDVDGRGQVVNNW